MIGDIEVEMCWVMENFWVILVEADLIFEDVIKCSIFVLDMNNYSCINEVYVIYFDEIIVLAWELVEVVNFFKFVNIEIFVIVVFD